MIDWKPIDTAPKDRRILLFCPSRSVGYCIAIGRWDDDRYANRPRPYWGYEGSSGILQQRHHQPTHWAELEEPADA